MKWLLCSRSRDEDEEEEGGSFVAAYNLVSRSSARLLRLQQGMLSVIPQWQMVGGLQAESPQVRSWSFGQRTRGKLAGGKKKIEIKIYG